MVLLDIHKHEKRSFYAKDFNHQKGYSFIIDLEDKNEIKRYIETGVYLHWQDEAVVDIAVDISCMCGCHLSCKFCATAGYNGGSLDQNQMFDQVRLSLNYVFSHEKDFVNKCGKVMFSFEGMGEPSYLCEEITETIIRLRKHYEPRFGEIQFAISTTAADSKAIKYWADCKGAHLQSLQVSLHACSDKLRREIIKSNTRIDSIELIFDALAYFHDKSPDTQIKINYLVIDHINDSREDLHGLLALVKDKQYYLKLSHLNDTRNSMENSYKDAGEGFQSFFNECRKNHKNTYEYGAKSPLKISCGQLASHVNSKSLNNESIKYIYEQLISRDVVLFLGAGVSSTFRNSKELANDLFDKLFANDRDMKKAYMSIRDHLTDVCDIYQIDGRSHEVHTYIKNRLENVRYPEEFLEMTKYPWNTIYTTNYDNFTEQAYHDAAVLRCSEWQCVCIINKNDLVHTLPENSIPLIKLHGCNSQDYSENVISSIDYLNNYESNKQYFFKMLESDFLRHTLVFAGYSFSDHYLSQLLYNANQAKYNGKNWDGKKAYAILPWEDEKKFYHSILSKKYGIELIDCTFEDFMNEIARLRKSLKVFVSGSKKASINNTFRKDQQINIEKLCQILGENFNQDGIQLINGATATDKAGYLVAKHMDKNKVETLYWCGADKVQGNEIEKMIRPTPYGLQPIDVIDQAIRVCNAAIFIGGASISLEEIMQALSRGKLIIPIKLGHPGYASDIIHTYIKNNLDIVLKMESDADKMPRDRAHRYFVEYLKDDAIDKLDLDAYSPEIVGETVMDILRKFRMDS